MNHFKVHKLNEKGMEKAKKMQLAFEELANTLVYIVEEGSPEMTIAMRKLEEASFYAKKAMAQQEGNQIQK